MNSFPLVTVRQLTAENSRTSLEELLQGRIHTGGGGGGGGGQRGQLPPPGKLIFFFFFEHSV